MRTMTMPDQFHAWLLGTHRDPDLSGRTRAFVVRRNVRLLPGEVVEFISVRHGRSTRPGGRRFFSVGLWKFNLGPIDAASVDQMCRHLQAFRAWYADAMSRIEVKGVPNVDPAGVHGNLVGSSIVSNSLVQLIASGFGDLTFWTYRRGLNRIEVEPYYEDSSSAARQPDLLKLLFAPRASRGLDHVGRRRTRRPRVSTAV